MDFIISSSFIYLFISIFVILLYGIISKSNLLNLAILGLSITFLLLFNLPFNDLIIFNGFLHFSYYTIFFDLIVIMGTIITLYLTKSYLTFYDLGELEIVLLILSNVLGLMIMINAGDLIIVYLGIEIQTLSLYILAGYLKESEIGLEAGIKYFILSAISSAILLLGIVFIYNMTGLTNINELEQIIIYKPNMMFGVLLFLIGLFFKLAIAPFHIWLPDIYEGIPDIITAYLAIVPKIGIIGLLAYLYSQLFYIYEFQYVLTSIIIISIMIGALMGLGQNDFKRLLAYSTIGHMANILIGLTGTILGIQGLIIYSVLYIITNGGLFAIIMNKQKKTNLSINDLAGFGRTNVVIGISLTLILFSLAGIPPLSGFFSKFLVYYSALEAGNILLPLVGVIGSVISSFFYIRIINLMYFKASSSNVTIQLDMYSSIIVYITLLIVIVFIISPTSLLIVSESVGYILNI